MPDPNSNNVYELGAFNADDLLDKIVELRARVVIAWRERAVMLTREEQHQLLAEIRLTCRLLGDLAH
jgi:hypothetical protein